MGSPEAGVRFFPPSTRRSQAGQSCLKNPPALDAFRSVATWCIQKGLASSIWVFSGSRSSATVTYPDHETENLELEMTIVPETAQVSPTP